MSHEHLPRLNPEFIGVMDSVGRLKAAKELDRQDQQEIISREYSFLEKRYGSVEDEAARLVLVQGISDLPNSRNLLEQIVKTERDPVIRHEAAFGLGLAKDPNAVPLLVNYGLSDVDPLVRHESAMALGNIADPIALEPLQDLLQNETNYGRNHIVVVSCRAAIAEIKYKTEKPRLSLRKSRKTI